MNGEKLNRLLNVKRSPQETISPATETQELAGRKKSLLTSLGGPGQDLFTFKFMQR